MIALNFFAVSKETPKLVLPSIVNENVIYLTSHVQCIYVSCVRIDCHYTRAPLLRLIPGFIVLNVTLIG